MLTMNLSNFTKNIDELLSQIIKYNEPININTKDGNAVLISEEEYNGLLETLYLSSIPEVKSSIIEGLNTPIKDCIPEDEVDL